MRMSALTAMLAAGIVVPSAVAEVVTLQAGGTIDNISNSPFAAPFGDIDVGTSWSFAIAYDTSIPPTPDGNPGFDSFKDSICGLEITIGDFTFTGDDFDEDCELIVTDNVCPCGGFTFDSSGESTLGFGYSFIIFDTDEDVLPSLELPGLDLAGDIAALAQFVQFDFFAPATINGITSNAASLQADFLTLEAGKAGPFIPAPTTAGLLGLAGIAGVRRRR